MTETIEISKLKLHPQNTEIYGKEDVSELAESIKQFGIKNPILVNSDNVIISGHRRYLAAKELDLKEIPFEIRLFDSPEDEIETLVLDNAYRAKTAEQKTREGLALEAAVAEKAKKRMAQGGKGGLDKGRENSAHPSPKGRTRDEVAKKVGISSGKQYDNNKKVIKEADNLKENCREQDAQLLTEIMNESPSAAHTLVTKVGVDNLTQENKDDLKSGKVSVNALVQQKAQEKPDSKPNKGITITTDNDKAEADKQAEIITAEAIKAEAKMFWDFSEGKITDLGLPEYKDEFTPDTLSKQVSFICNKADEFIKILNNYAWLTNHIKELFEIDRDKYLSSLHAVKVCVIRIESNITDNQLSANKDDSEYSAEPTPYNNPAPMLKDTLDIDQPQSAQESEKMIEASEGTRQTLIQEIEQTDIQEAATSVVDISRLTTGLENDSVKNRRPDKSKEMAEIRAKMIKK